MFEDDVTVPAGWYPDPMGVPQLRWWNNHAWTELTTEARPPLVMQNPTRLAYADEELPTRRQQREQREREQRLADPATDEEGARDATGNAPMTVTLKEIARPASEELDSPVPSGGATTPFGSIGLDIPRLDTTHVDGAAFDRAAFDSAFSVRDDEAVDDADRDAILFDTSATPEPVAARADSIAFESLFTPRSAHTAVSGATLQRENRPAPVGPDDEVARRSRWGSRLPIYTASVWIIALIPVVVLLISLLLLLGFGSTLNAWVTPSICVASYLLVVILAIADRASLGRAGYEHRASWTWALLTAPGYLIARSASLAKVGPVGFAPLLVWAALCVLQVGSVLVVPGLLISALPSVFAAQAERSIASDASIIGADLTVSCTKTLPVLIGQTFSCAARTAAGDSYDVTVTLRRTNGWIDWHVDDWGIYTLSR
jgi:hypothetical protein